VAGRDERRHRVAVANPRAFERERLRQPSAVMASIEEAAASERGRVERDVAEAQRADWNFRPFEPIGPRDSLLMARHANGLPYGPKIGRDRAFNHQITAAGAADPGVAAIEIR